MSQQDIDKWNKKYQAVSGLTDFVPDRELINFQASLPDSGTALDLACGAGKNTLFLLERGLNVMAIDGSEMGLQWIRKEAENRKLGQNLELIQADLDEYVLPRSRFELIVVVRYLNRQIIKDISTALKPGGVLFYKTFNRNILKSRPGFNPAFTIETHELIGLFPKWMVLEDNRDDQLSDSAFVLLKKPA